MDAITIKNLVVERGGKTILHDMTASLSKGNITAVIGPNGCGKSTFLKAVNCMIPIAGGSIEISREIAFLTQSHDLPNDVPVADLVAMGRFPYRRLLSPLTKDDRDAVARAIDAVGLAGYEKRAMQHLSGGEQQRAWLAVLLAQDAPILLLDEPTTYLDVRHQLRILKLLRDINETWKKTIVIVLHDMNQAYQYADDVIIMKEGAIVSTGAPHDILTPAMLRDVFDIEAEVVATKDGRPFIVPTDALP